MTELDLARIGIDANLDHLHVQQWAFQAAQLRQILADAPDTERRRQSERWMIITTLVISPKPAVLF